MSTHLQTHAQLCFDMRRQRETTTSDGITMNKRKATPGCSDWLNANDACDQLGIGSTALRNLQWAGDLTPGKHWIYANGKPNGPVRFNVPAIREWQAAKTVEAFNSANRIETYQEDA